MVLQYLYNILVFKEKLFNHYLQSTVKIKYFDWALRTLWMDVTMTVYVWKNSISHILPVSAGCVICIEEKGMRLHLVFFDKSTTPLWGCRLYSDWSCALATWHSRYPFGQMVCPHCSPGFRVENPPMAYAPCDISLLLPCWQSKSMSHGCWAAVILTWMTTKTSKPKQQCQFGLVSLSHWQRLVEVA